MDWLLAVGWLTFSAVQLCSVSVAGRVALQLPGRLQSCPTDSVGSVDLHNHLLPSLQPPHGAIDYFFQVEIV